MAGFEMLLQFIEQNEKIALVAPAPENARPNYTSEFFDLLKPTIAPKPIPLDQAEAMEEFKQLHERYLNHGKSDQKRGFSLITDPLASDLPAAYGNKGVCLVFLRNDYKPVLSELGMSADMNEPAGRKYIAIHEDAHCRTGPYMNQSKVSASLAKGGAEQTTNSGSKLADNYIHLVAENVADSQAIMSIALHDGPEAANKIADKTIAWRQTTKLKDPEHDTIESIRMVKEIINHHPEKIASEKAVFQMAIEIGVQASTKTFAAAMTEENKVHTISDSFKMGVDAVSNGLYKAVQVYQTGPYSTGDVKVFTKDGATEVKSRHVVNADTATLNATPPADFLARLKSYSAPLFSIADNTLSQSAKMENVETGTAPNTRGPSASFLKKIGSIDAAPSARSKIQILGVN